MVRVMRAVFMVLLVLLVAGGCSKTEKAATDPVPSGFDLPAGVTLTKGGTALTYGDSASVIYQAADKARSVIAVTVDKVITGDIKDFRFFSLDDAAQESTPVYVSATVKNLGPADLGGALVPLYVHDSTNTVAPPNELAGNFRPCPNGALPKAFLPAASADVCLVYLLPKGASLESIDLRTTDLKTAIVWKP